MSEIDPHNLGKPLFEENQVLTRKDLLGIRNGYIYLYEFYHDDPEAHQWLTAAGTVEQIIDYLDRGKVAKEIK